MENTEVLRTLGNFSPKFLTIWNDPQNVNISEDGGYSRDGVLAEFAQFFVDNFKGMGPQEVSSLFCWIEEMLNANTDPNLIGGVRVCFLENIAHTSAGEAGMKLMGPKTRAAFDEFL
jgi:hypothetical protein